jgi:hypothetical protein
MLASSKKPSFNCVGFSCKPDMPERCAKKRRGSTSYAFPESLAQRAHAWNSFFMRKGKFPAILQTLTEVKISVKRLENTGFVGAAKER